MKPRWVEDPENWYLVEAAHDNGYVDEIFTTYYDNEQEYLDDLGAIRSQQRWYLIRHRPPVRAGLVRFRRPKRTT